MRALPLTSALNKTDRMSRDRYQRPIDCVELTCFTACEPMVRSTQRKCARYKVRGGSVRANAVSEPRDRSEPAQRRARARVGESEGRSPSDENGGHVNGQRPGRHGP